MSGWMRAGVFCTALWVVAMFGYATWHYVYRRNHYPQSVLETCKQYALNTSRCNELLARTQEEWKRIPFDWIRPAILALGPPLLIWALAWAVTLRAGDPMR
jgi:hypothetical protein